MLNPVSSPVKTLEDLSSILASTICERFKPSDPALALLQDKLTAAKFLSLLIEKSLFPDAVNVLAQTLPKRKAIWWAYIVAFQTENDQASLLTQKALSLIQSWVYKPTEATRREAQIVAEKLEFKTPTGWAAMAVFWSGGSITAQGTPEVMPQEYLYAKAVAGAVMLAAVHKAPEKLNENYQRFLNQGLDIANGGNGEI